MRTAIQEFIEYLEKTYYINELTNFDKDKIQFLEKEKEQMVNFAKKYANYVLDDKPFISVKNFFDQTYNQNEI
jgi:hypothetical protein